MKKRDKGSLKILVLGGVSRSLLNFRGPLLKCLKSRGHEVLASASEDEDAEGVAQELAEMGIDFVPIELARGGVNALQDLKTFLAIRTALKKHRPNVLLAYTVKPIIYGGLATRSVRGTRFIPLITGLGYAFTEGKDIRRRWLSKIVKALYGQGLKRAEVVIFQNPDDQALFQELGLIPPGGRSLWVYGSGVDLNLFPSRPLPDAPVFLMMARLLADKGVREYAMAAQKVKTRFPDARFQLAGAPDSNPSGINLNEVHSWVNEGVLEYLGNLKGVQEALSRCRYYVLPSYYREGIPRSIIEAMATGRPIITTNTPGCRETVEHGRNGLLVRPRDADSLAQAMFALLKTPEAQVQAMAAESLRMAEERFDVHKVNASILQATGL